MIRPELPFSCGAAVVKFSINAVNIIIQLNYNSLIEEAIVAL